MVSGKIPLSPHVDYHRFFIWTGTHEISILRVRLTYKAEVGSKKEELFLNSHFILLN